MPGEVTALIIDVVIQPVDAGIYQADHILGTREFGFAIVFETIEFPDQFGFVAIRYFSVPYLPCYLARAGTYTAAVHKTKLGRDLHRDHRSGGRRIVFRDVGLINPSAGQGQTVGDVAHNVGYLSFGLPSHGTSIT